MAVAVQTWWRPEALKAKVLNAHVKASEDVRKAAIMKCRSSHVRAGIRAVIEGNRAVVVAPGKVARYLEHGTSAHDESPKTKQAMKLKDGGFVRGSIPNPGMKAEPFLRPAAALYPELYRARAREALA